MGRRQRAAGQGHRERPRQDGRAVLDGCRCASSTIPSIRSSPSPTGRPQGSRHRQPDVRRHGQCLGRQRVAMGYDPGPVGADQPALSDGGGGGGEQSPSYVFDSHYTVAKILHPHRRSDRSRNAACSPRRSGTRCRKKNRTFEEGRAAKPRPKSGDWTTYEQETMAKAKSAGVEITEIAGPKSHYRTRSAVWDTYGPKYADMIKRIRL